MLIEGEGTIRTIPGQLRKLLLDSLVNILAELTQHLKSPIRRCPLSFAGTHHLMLGLAPSCCLGSAVVPDKEGFPLMGSSCFT